MIMKRVAISGVVILILIIVFSILIDKGVDNLCLLNFISVTSFYLGLWCSK